MSEYLLDETHSDPLFGSEQLEWNVLLSLPGEGRVDETAACHQTEHTYLQNQPVLAILASLTPNCLPPETHLPSLLCHNNHSCGKDDRYAEVLI